jgi:purine-binding chemotaxis protein CheW
MAQLFLIAHVAGRAVAIDSDQVESVVDIGEITPVPMAARQVRGLAALRSRVVTVIDTCAALGLPSAAHSGRAVVTQVDGHHYAFVVEALEDVAAFEREPLGSAFVLELGWRAAGCGVVTRDGEPILIIDLRALTPGLAAAA